MQKVNRETLLRQLDSVQPGISSREILEQSSCFIFTKGLVMTFNDEIACSHKCDLKLDGAVQADPLLAILRKLPEDEVDIELTDGYLIIKGVRRTAEIRHEAEVLLRVDKVEQPDKWFDLPPEFLEGVKMVQHCAGSDQSKFELTCVHLHADYLEACDNFQATRVKMRTGLKGRALVRRDSIKHIVGLGMTQCSETKTWLHFRNKDGLVLSCRRFENEYHPIDKLLDFKGEKIKLPKGLATAVDLAQVFSAQNAEENCVTVELRPGTPHGKLRLTGEGASGRYREYKDLEYNGPAMQFLIAPQLLVDITDKHTEAEITEGRLRVDGGKWVYMTCLTAPAEMAAEREQKKAEKAEKTKKKSRDND